MRGSLTRSWILIWILALGVYVLHYFPQWIEHYYTQGIYPYIAQGFRLAFGWLPFSVGDLFYLAGLLLLVYRGIRGIYRLIKSDRNRSLADFKVRILRLITLFLGIYILFNLSWGLNYYRLGVRHTLKLQVPEQYSTGRLQALTRTLLEETNTARKRLPEELVQVPAQRIFQQALQAYKQTANTFPFLAYHSPSVKTPLWNELGNYLGYGGYFNPFTHEAQVHTHVPVFLLPFTTCHEMAHQLGYASEDEANFVGYLTASASADPLFDYSVHFAMYRYANRELWYRDSTLAKRNYAALDTLVKQDYQDMIRFFSAYENKMEDVSSFLYDKYLMANNQPQGLATYSRVTALLLAYRKTLPQQP